MTVGSITFLAFVSVLLIISTMLDVTIWKSKEIEEAVYRKVKIEVGKTDRNFTRTRSFDDHFQKEFEKHNIGFLDVVQESKQKLLVAELTENIAKSMLASKKGVNYVVSSDHIGSANRGSSNCLVLKSIILEN